MLAKEIVQRIVDTHNKPLTSRSTEHNQAVGHFYMKAGGLCHLDNDSTRRAESNLKFTRNDGVQYN